MALDSHFVNAMSYQVSAPRACTERREGTGDAARGWEHCVMGMDIVMHRSLLLRSLLKLIMHMASRRSDSE